MRRRLLVIAALILAHLVGAAAAQTGQGLPAEWDKIVEAAKKEGKVVVSIPPSRKLRRGMEVAFTRRYGIGLEFVSARSSASIQKIISETKAGIQYVDLHVGGTESAVTGLLAEEACIRWSLISSSQKSKIPSSGGAAISGWTTPSALSMHSPPIRP